MTEVVFTGAEFMHSVIVLRFARGQGSAFTVTIPAENASALVAGVMNAVRVAGQRGWPLSTIGAGESAEITALPVDDCDVLEPSDAEEVLMHLSSAGGLSLVYAFDAVHAKRVGCALTEAAELRTGLR